ncbi:MAG: cadmium-translocating P-type ATPase [Synergistaceae bacterium]|nr:cadmium-translocating P-type ATPase [Synergistaceae bacterium]
MNEHVKVLLRIIFAGLILACLIFFRVDNALLFLVPYLIAGYDVLFEAVEGIMKREIFDECFLMTIATVGALILGEYSETSAVMILYQLGELFQDYASDKSRDSITELMNLRPDYANVERDGTLEKVSPEEVKTGTIITIKPGEKVPVDGVIIEGSSSIDTGALTGESLPRDVKVDDEVLSGCINLSGVLKVKTTCEFSQSTASKILELVENASSRKSHSEKFITRFAKVYTPVVCILALSLVIIPSLINPANFHTWLYRALTFLVISCPCALVISIPLTFFAGIGGAGRAGILVKGSNFLEMLAKTSCCVFDKTGTLTQGVFEVVAVHPDIMNETELLHMAAHVERYSTHPAAEALRRAYPNEADDCEVEEVEEIAGYGVRAKVNGDIICVGSSKFMEKINAKWHPCTKIKSGTVIHVAINGNYAGHVVISDVVKPNAKKAIDELKSLNVKRIIMLTGDTNTTAQEVARNLGLEEFYAELLPSGKVAKVEELITSDKAAFVGDGINDAPVLARADVGLAMGALGSDAAIEAADVVLMDDDVLKVPKAVKISRKTMRIVKENIYFSVGVKILCLILGALGIANMWLAIFADVGIMILCVINAIRAMY